MKNKRIMVVGGAGFIGSRLTARLCELGCAVTVFDNLHPQVHFSNELNYRIAKSAGANILIGDIRSRGDIESAMSYANPDAVYHLAAETGTGQSFDHPARYTEVNVVGTANLIEAIRSAGKNVERVVVAGSRSVYGEGTCIDGSGAVVTAKPRSANDLDRGEYRPRSVSGEYLTPIATSAEKCETAPASVYASTKLMQEYLLSQSFWGTDTQVGILRLQNVYGPGQSMANPYTGVISIFADQLLRGHDLSIFEDGQITRDFVYVDDVVSAFVATLQVQQLGPDILDIGTGRKITILEVASLLISLLGTVDRQAVLTGRYRPGDVRFSLADISRAKQVLSWSPKIDLETGLRRFSEWAKGQR